MTSRASEHLEHRLGHLPQRGQQIVAALGRTNIGRFGDRARQQHAGGHLGVERLGRGDAHLDVTAIARVHHAVGLVGEIAVAAIDDSEHRRAAAADQIDRAIGVGGGAALADGDDQRVAHVEPHPEAAELGRGDRIDVELAVGQRIEHRRHAATGDGCGALADDLDLGDAPVGQPGADVGGQGAMADRGATQAVDLDDLAAHGLAETCRRLADLLQQVVRRVAAIDVAGGDLCGGDVALGQRQLASVVGHPADAVELAGLRTVEDEHLPAAARRRRRSRRPCG